LRGRVALVTGGGRGIGSAIAKVFAAEGAAVVITYRTNADRATETLKALKAAGATSRAIQADLRVEEDCRRVIETTVAEFGRINVLVNNAGAVGVELPIAELPADEWDSVLSTDLRGMFLITKFALPHMPSEPVGKIINVGSELGLIGRAGFAHYCAAKAGVIGFTYALAREVAPGICANVIAPGPVETEMILADMAPEWVEKEKDIPARRLGKVEEIAETALLLASSAGDFFIGQVVSPNGGAVFR